MLLKNSVDLDQSVLSRSLALRNTILEKSTRVGADYENVVINELRESIRNGFMPHIMGHKLSHIHAREVR
jgi:hypothetical protein